jgi:hypothetical protein
MMMWVCTGEVFSTVTRCDGASSRSLLTKSTALACAVRGTAGVAGRREGYDTVARDGYYR